MNNKFISMLLKYDRLLRGADGNKYVADAVKLSDEIHDAEGAGYALGVIEDLLWRKLTSSIEMLRHNEIDKKDK